MKESLTCYSLKKLEEIVSHFGEPSFRAKQIFDAIKKGKQIDEISNISKSLKEKLKENTRQH